MKEDHEATIKYWVSCPDDSQDMQQVTFDILRFMHEKIKNRECFLQSEIETGMNLLIQCMVTVIKNNYPHDLQDLAMDSVYLTMKKNMEIIREQNEK